MSAGVVQSMIAAVERSGVPRHRYLQAAQLESGVFADAELRVGRDQVFQLTEVALDVTADPAFGLHWAEWLSSSFSLMSQLLVHAPNLREAFETFFEYGALVNDDLELEFAERDGVAVLRCNGPNGNSLRYQRTVSEMVTHGMVHLVTQFNPGARMERVNFAYPAPEYRCEYARVFRSRERFDQPFTGVVFDGRLLDSLSPYQDAEMGLSLRTVASRRIARLKLATPYVRKVTEFLIQDPAPHRVPMGTVARAMSLSERSLHRRLADAGSSYSEIANTAAATVAKRLLVEQRFTIKQAAHYMKFADVSAFHRAFKRWMGATPSGFLRPSVSAARSEL